MELPLFDYQRDAVVACLARLKKAKRAWTEDGDRSAFALSAVTGSGKTVIATAVIEAIIFGSAEFGVEPDDRAVFLWVTDDPALNRQTRAKMRAASDLLTASHLVELNDGFLGSKLDPAHVYLLNIQQLATTAGFAKGGNNFREFSGWDVIANTIAAADRDLYLVLDEAQRGMKPTAGRATIVQRIIGGQTDSNPPVPIVWGISATIDRFLQAMKNLQAGRDMYAPVAVDTALVRAAGIIKDQIVLDRPAEPGDFTATLLRNAVDSTCEFEARWAAYSESEGARTVLPALVIQVGDKPTAAHLAELVGVVESQWSAAAGKALGPWAMVNVFGEHSDLVVGARKIRYVNPETIQEDESVRVVLAKSAISTGWDCPRAEVLFSERVASDATNIAQIIGRMVRSPLAHRITTDTTLNSVTCFLPRFDRAAVLAITEELTRPGDSTSVAEVIVNAKDYGRNPQLPSEVFSLIEDLPSWPKPDLLADPLRRAMALIKLLTDDGDGAALLSDAGEQFDKFMNARLDGLAAEHAAAVAANVANLEAADIERLAVDVGETDADISSHTYATALADLDRETRKRVRAVREGVGRRYVNHVLDKGDDDELGVRTTVAALFMVEGVRAAVDAAADEWVNAQRAKFAAAIKLTTGETRAAYTRVLEMAATQEVAPIELPLVIKTATTTIDKSDGSDVALPTYAKHVFADHDGLIPLKLNDWETDVVTTEVARATTVGWYRNPSRATLASLRIGYATPDDQNPHAGAKWDSLQVDFIVAEARPDGSLVASILDPHGDHLSDALPKLRALAAYAERFGERFARIEAIAKGSHDHYRALDLQNPKVRKAVASAAGPTATPLYDDTKLSQPYQ